MFEPLRELLPENPQALIDDARVLGEKAGRLFGSREGTAYTALGGAVYQPLRCANDGVVRWAEEEVEKHETCTAARATATLNNRELTTSSCHGEDGEKWWAWALFSLAPPSKSCGRARCCNRSWLRQALETAPHILPHLLHCTVKAVAFFLPSLRSLFPTAVPHATRLLGARQSRRGGPERVTALCFHPLYMWLAVSVEEGSPNRSARVVLYDVGKERTACVLTHAFQTEVSWLQWKPYAQDVLAVGCRGGVLLWSLSAGNPSMAADGAAVGFFAETEKLETSARALFYPICSGFTVTAGAFSNRGAAMLACTSVCDTRLFPLLLVHPPCDVRCCAGVVVPTVDGGLGSVLFDDDDHFMLCTVCGHASLALVRSTSPRASGVAFQSSVIPTPAPVHCLVRATGLGPSLYFLCTAALEGVLVARINPYVGVEVTAMISTGLYRGVGGCVTRVVCSRRRVWMLTETNHLLVCRYGKRENGVTLLPVGVAPMEAVEMASFTGCQTGSLVAIVDSDGTIEFIPSYHH